MAQSLLMAATLQRSTPIDIVAGEPLVIGLLDDSNQGISPDSESSPNRTASTSSLHESGSSGSLDAHSSASSSPTSGIRRHVASVKPGRSCLSSRGGTPRRKTVTFAMDSPSPSSDDLMTEYNIDIALGTRNAFNEGHNDLGFGEKPISPVSSKAPLDKALKHMEALSLKRYHAQLDHSPSNDSQQALNDPFRSDSPNLPSTPFINSSLPQSPSISGPNLHSKGESDLRASKNSISLTSPLSSLKLLGSEIDHSACILQSFLNEAATPNTDVEVSSAWSWSTSLVVTAPVVFGLVMDSLLG